MRTSQAFATTTTFSNDPFFQRFGTHLPRDLRAQAQGLAGPSSPALQPHGGPFRLGIWTSEHLAPVGTVHRPLGLGDRISSAAATATGPIAALTSMLFDAGFQLRDPGRSTSSARRRAPRRSSSPSTTASAAGRCPSPRTATPRRGRRSSRPPICCIAEKIDLPDPPSTGRHRIRVTAPVTTEGPPCLPPVSSPPDCSLSPPPRQSPPPRPPVPATGSADLWQPLAPIPSLDVAATPARGTSWRLSRSRSHLDCARDTRATYGVLDASNVSVNNTCTTWNGGTTASSATPASTTRHQCPTARELPVGTVPELPDGPTNYVVTYLADDYSWSFVGDPLRVSGFVLSRTPPGEQRGLAADPQRRRVRAATTRAWCSPRPPRRGPTSPRSAVLTVRPARAIGLSAHSLLLHAGFRGSGLSVGALGLVAQSLFGRRGLTYRGAGDVREHALEDDSVERQDRVPVGPARNAFRRIARCSSGTGAAPPAPTRHSSQAPPGYAFRPAAAAGGRGRSPPPSRSPAVTGVEMSRVAPPTGDPTPPHSRSSHLGSPREREGVPTVLTRRCSRAPATTCRHPRRTRRCGHR